MKFALLSLALLSSALAFAAPEKGETRSSVAQASVELFGAGGWISAYGSYWVTPAVPLAVNAGVGYSDIVVTEGWGYASHTIVSFPLSLSLLMGGESHFVDLTAGGVFSTYSAPSKDDALSVNAANSLGLGPASGLIGIGYRLWPSTGGFHLRAMLYGVMNTGGFRPWAGLSAGWAF